MILKDTSLCAIVRDEMTNPAGGIVDFIESTAPYVEKAIIIDTGSVDGTKETLKKLGRKLPSLSIYHCPFTDYATARNYGLSKVKTEKVLVLDADERLFPEDFRKLGGILKCINAEGYHLKVVAIFPTLETDCPAHNPRLFNLKTKLGLAHYRANAYGYSECLFVRDEKNSLQRFDDAPGLMWRTEITIKHFMPEEWALKMKKNYWYDEVMHKRGGSLTAPSKTRGFEKWKEYNPRRTQFT